MASAFTRTLLRARPLPPSLLVRSRVLARFASHAPPGNVGDAGASPPFPETAEQLKDSLEDLFKSEPIPDDSEPEPPVYTLSTEELEEYKQHLPSHLTADTYATFKDSPIHKATLATILKRGGTVQDVQGFEYLILDPDLNGGYVNPPRIKRSHRDPYGDWWDKQERRNYGEPVHEDNDMLGIFSLEDYNVFTAKKVFQGWAIFVSSVLGLLGVVYLVYPEKPVAPRTAPGGLLEEYGGPGALPAPADEE